MEILTNDIIFTSGPKYTEAWKSRTRRKVRKAKPGDIIVVRSGLQAAFAAAYISHLGRTGELKVIKRG
jgi:hypothetical protein